MPHLNGMHKEIFWGKALREAACIFALTSIILAILFLSMVALFHPELKRFANEDARALTFSGSELLPASLGSGHRDSGQFFISGFNKDEAVLVLQREFQAEEFPFIKVNLKGLTRFTTVKLLWQKSGSPEIFSRAFNRTGDGLTQLAMSFAGDDYAGTISSVALLFYDRPAQGFKNNNGEVIVISDIELRTLSTRRIIEQIFSDWTNPPVWGPSSINTVEGTYTPQFLKPNLAVYLVVLTALAITVIKRRAFSRPSETIRRAPVFAVALSLCLHGWLLNESLRWGWRIEQFIDARERYANLQLAQRIKNNDARCGMYPDDCASFLYPYF